MTEATTPLTRAEVWHDRAERVNDFAAPWDINLVCGRLVHWSVFSPLVVG